MEADHGVEVLSVGETASSPLDGNDLAIEVIGDGICDRMAAVADDVVELPRDHPGHGNDRGVAAPHGPVSQAIEESLRSALCRLRQEIPQALLGGSGLGHLENACLELFEEEPPALADVLLRGEPEVLRSLESVISMLAKPPMLSFAD